MLIRNILRNILGQHQIEDAKSTYDWYDIEYQILGFLIIVQKGEECSHIVTSGVLVYCEVSVPHQMWHGTSVHNGHIRRPLILTRVAELLPLELSLPVLKT